MIISFNGDEGSGKSTIATKLAEKLGYPRYYMGKIFRELAEKNKMTLSEFQNLCDKDSTADKQVDDYLIDLSKKFKDFIIESRTAWHFIPSSLKVYLEVSELEGARRIFEHMKKEKDRNEDENLNSIEAVMESEKARRVRDDKRYMTYYGINIRDKKNYDFVLNTTNLTIDEVFEKVINFIQSKNAQPN